MAVQSTSQWWIRTDGDNTNGGGYDSVIAGSGTNYSDQGSSQLSLTDLATASIGSTTLTSSAGGLTAAMVGNAIQIVSGTNSAAGFYFITGFTDGNTVTIDRACDDGVGGLSGGSGKLGGALAGLEMLSDHPSHTSYAPTVRGNTINIRGSGGDNPATPDYTLTGTNSVLLLPDATNEHIMFNGYNGRPHYRCSPGSACMFYNERGIDLKNIRISANGTTNGLNGMVFGADNSLSAVECAFDQNGNAVRLLTRVTAYGCILENTGPTTSGSAATAEYCDLYSCILDNLSGGIYVRGQNVVGCSITRVKSYGIFTFQPDGDTYVASIYNNVIADCTGDGITTTENSFARVNVNYNVVTGCGGYGINTSGSDRKDFRLDYNFMYNNASGNYNGYSGGANDTILTADPYVDSANGDFNLNATAGGGAILRATYNTKAAVTRLYPFRPLVSDDFDPGGGGGATHYDPFTNPRF